MNKIRDPENNNFQIVKQVAWWYTSNGQDIRLAIESRGSSNDSSSTAYINNNDNNRQ